MQSFLHDSRYYDMMKSLISFLFAMIFIGIFPATAAENLEKPVDGIPSVGSGRMRLTQGYYHFVSEDGDSTIMIVLNTITVYPPLKFKNKKQEQFYWRTVRDVKKTLPYAKLICETLLETYEYIETFPTQKERERHLKEMEGAVFEQYKPVLKKFTKSQAKMLIKLIKSETNQSSYNILTA